MNIIHDSCTFLNQTKIIIPKKVHKLYEFGFKSLSIQRIVSLNSNARSTVSNLKTAESKVYRLTCNQRLLSIFPKLLNYLKLIEENDLINIDFSDFGGRQVLLFAKQTQDGRAIPLYFEFIRYPIRKGSQNTFILNTISHFLNIVGVKVRLVFDRGFAIPCLVEFLAKKSTIFYIRVKKNKKVKIKNQSVKVSEIISSDNRVIAYDRYLRLIVTSKPEFHKEPWYIITNDEISSKDEIANIYYYRFEIEELFRDAKRVFGLEYINFKKDISFSIVLWFVILGTWFVWYLHEIIDNSKRAIKRYRKGFNLSIIYFWLEKIKYAIQSVVLEQIRIDDS